MVCKGESWGEIAVKHREPSLVLCDDLKVGVGVREGGLRRRVYMCGYGSFPLFCMTEANTCCEN